MHVYGAKILYIVNYFMYKSIIIHMSYVTTMVFSVIIWELQSSLSTMSPLPRHSQSYGRPSELGQEMRVFVQSVTPGSPAFMSGLFPGDTILEVNGVDVRCDPVAAVVKKIMDVPRKNDKKSVSCRPSLIHCIICN